MGLGNPEGKGAVRAWRQLQLVSEKDQPVPELDNKARREQRRNTWTSLLGASHSCGVSHCSSPARSQLAWVAVRGVRAPRAQSRSIIPSLKQWFLALLLLRIIWGNV